MLTVAHVGGGGVKYTQNYAHVINGRPPTSFIKRTVSIKCTI